MTPEQIEKSRAEFESQFAEPYKLLKDQNGDYRSLDVEYMWGGWLLRQETLCVELPKCHEGKAVHNQFNHCIGLVEQALDATGVAYK